MKSLFQILLAVGLSATALLNAADPALPSRPELVATMKRVVDFQVSTYGKKQPVDWQSGTFFTGVVAAYQVSGDKHFLDLARSWSEKAGWKTRGNIFNADSICIAQTYLDLYAIEKNPHMIADIRAKLDPYFTKDSITKAESGVPAEGPQPFTGRNIWWWCDALYMAPPVLTRLAAATGDARYLELMHKLYWDTTDHLYVPADQLFLRDRNFISKRTPQGKNVYWSRGNGWVYAGLVRVLDTLPINDPRRGDYLKLYLNLTEAILRYQGEDGLWRTSLNEPTWLPEKETSGTSFFCFGLLAGVNRSWLPQDRYLPPALKAWAGLQTCLGKDGKLGYAQAVADRPGRVAADHSIDYTQGAFLLAASELYKLTPAH